MLFWTATLALIASLDEDFGDSLEEDLSSLTLDDDLESSLTED
ncbi:hypothetical protein [Fibrobacter sp.]|nr:hypothetical protein [Fibrobacter sp.]